MTATPPDVLRRQIMLTVYGARPELGTDGAGEVADALLSAHDVTPGEARDGSGGAEGGSAVPVEGSGAPAGSQGVTEADRELAVGLLSSARADDIWRTDNVVGLVDRIAAALAEERAKARAPFLALAVLLDGAAITASSREHRAFVPGTEAARAKAYRDAAGRIRRAAEETE